MKNVLLKNAYSCGRSAEGLGGPRGVGLLLLGITLAGGAKDVYPLLPECSDSVEDLSLCDSTSSQGVPDTLPLQEFPGHESWVTPASSTSVNWGHWS